MYAHRDHREELQGERKTCRRGGEEGIPSGQVFRRGRRLLRLPQNGGEAEQDGTHHLLQGEHDTRRSIRRELL